MFHCKKKSSTTMSEEDEATPIALDDDDDDEDEDYHGCCFRCLTKLGCSRVAQLPYNMPRICGLMLGVVGYIRHDIIEL